MMHTNGHTYAQMEKDRQTDKKTDIQRDNEVFHVDNARIIIMLII